MRQFTLAILLVLSTSQVCAWWNGPYAYAPQGYPYAPNAWPNYGYPGINNSPYNYGGSDWNVRGFMTERGDTRFVIEYRGNIYDDMFGYGYRRPRYNGFPGYPYPGNRW